MIFLDEPRLLRHRNQRTQVVEEVDEKKDKDNLKEPKMQRPTQIEFESSRRNRRQAVRRRMPVDQTQRPSAQRGADDADQHPSPHLPDLQRGNKQNAKQSQRRLRAANIA